ncbi:hypothetical protein Tco_1015393 [Tanacetum coccineum]|uniref:Uncharacterized protein n=1 Tax=Tanacetum coccineum TaxID=301880 RepID=A0ABQ5FKP1_9ASTR
MLNLFTPADEEFFNEGVRDESAIKRSWKLLCQSVQQQANTLLRFEALKEQHTDLLSKNYDGALTREKSLQDRLKELEEEKKQADQLNSSRTDQIKQLEEALKAILKPDAQCQLRVEKGSLWAVEAGNANGEVFILAVGKGFIDGISIGRKDADIQAILKATPNVDLASSDTFIDEYEKLFDRRSHSFAESSDTPTASIA